MKLLSLHLRNFISVKKLSIDFEKLNGITVIDGRNGSGKSAVFIEAIVWLLYGKTIRKIRVTDIMREGSDEATQVSGTLLMDDGRTLLIERSRGKHGASLNFSFIGGKGGTTSGKQEVLERIIGFDFKLFTSSVVFGGAGISSFCALSDADRKDVLERLLDLERYSRAAQIAAETSGRISLKEEQARKECDRLSYLLEEENQNKVKWEVEKKRFESKREKEIEERKKKLAGLQEMLEEYKQQLVFEEKKFADERSAYEKQNAKWKKRADELESELKVATTRRLKAKANLEIARTELDNAKEEARRVEAEEPPPVCPFCGTPREKWPDPKIRPVSVEAPLKRLQNARQAYQHAKNAYERARMISMQAEGEVKSWAKEAPVPPDDSRVREVKASIRDAEKDVQVAKQMLAEAEKRRKNPYGRLLKKSLARIKSMEKRLTAYRNRLARYEIENEAVRFWVTGFSRRGLPGYLLDEAAPFLTKRSRRYASLLTDGMLDIRFNPAEGKHGKAFQPLVENADGGSSYDKCSKGERARVDLCVLLALRDLMESRAVGGFDQIFLDEVFDGLDDEGLERVMVMLRKVFKNRSVFVITHNPALKNEADHAITVEKRNNATVLKYLDGE